MSVLYVRRLMGFFFLGAVATFSVAGGCAADECEKDECEAGNVALVCERVGADGPLAANRYGCATGASCLVVAGEAFCSNGFACTTSEPKCRDSDTLLSCHNNSETAISCSYSKQHCVEVGGVARCK